jgi:CDP-diacylglycerol--serine O-phosphatidyltransferase
VLLYTIAIAVLMVSKVPTFSIKLIGQRIAREHVPPIFVLAAMFIALLITYPSLTLFAGSVTYLALMPVSAYRYFQLERADERRAKSQNGKSAEPTAIAERPSKPQAETGLSAKP